MSDKMKQFTYSADGPERLDKVLLAECHSMVGITRSQISSWIEQGMVVVNEKVENRPGARLLPGAVVKYSIPAAAPTALQPYAFHLDIVFEDDYLLVINKPSNLSMHPGAGNKHETLANAVVAHVGSDQRKVGPADRPGIVHRLDKDTTGLVVVAKTVGVHAHLSDQFARRTIGREYCALVFTTPRSRRIIQEGNHGEICAPIGRHPTERTKMAVVPNGRRAVTRWKVLERFEYGTLVSCRLDTGRTHQIRVHMNSIGSPVLGDRQYGDFSSLPRILREKVDLYGRQVLHAEILEFLHPISSKPNRFFASPPQDMVNLINNFRNFG